MKRSTDRILTTHAGRLSGPPEIADSIRSQGRTTTDDQALKSGIVDVIRKQAAAGIDVISDGELGKVGMTYSFYSERIEGLGTRPLKEGEASAMSGHTNEHLDFEEFSPTRAASAAARRPAPPHRPSAASSSGP